MPHAVFEMDPPNPFAVGFDDGERWLSPYDPPESTPKGTYYFARRFMLTGGNYEIKIFVDDAATMWVGKRFDSAAQNGSWLIEQAVVRDEVYLPPGQQRIDFIVQNLPAAPTPAGFIFSLWQDGRPVYVSTKEGWLWDTRPITDEELPALGDPRRAMVVLTTLPNWAEGIVERLSWLTDIMASETGAEQRRALRQDPRRTFEMNFLRKGPNRTALDSFLTGVGQNEFLLPLFHEAITMTEGIAAGASGVDFVQGLGSEREWQMNDLALVINSDPGVYEVLKVGTVNEDSMTWATPPERNWIPGTRIYPLREARMLDSGQLQNLSDDVGQLVVRFELSNPMRVGANWLAEINGDPLFPFIPDRASPVSGDYSRLANMLDNEVGRFTVTDIAEHTAVQVGMSFTLFGRSNVYRLRQFLAAARGRCRGFLLPTFTDDLVPINGDIPASNVLTVKAAGLGRYHLRPQSTRSMVAVTLAGQDLPLLARNIKAIERQFVDNVGLDVDYVTDVWYDRLLLDAPMPALRADQYKRLSFISESRFAQDDFEIEHVTNTSAAVRFALSVRQLRERRLRDNAPKPQPEFPPLDISPVGPLFIADATVQDVRRGVARCEAGYSLRNDGVIELRTESDGRTTTMGTWLADPREANLFDVRATLVSGNGVPQTGELGAWQNLGGTRRWSVRSDDQGRRDLILMLEIRESTSKTIRASCYVTLVAFANA